MQIQTWAWLIGLSNESDARLLQWAKSYSNPPSLEVTGARINAESYLLERRAIALTAEADSVKLKLTPSGICLNPVFEIAKASSQLTGVTVNDSRLPAESWSWDGKVLWLNATFEEPATLELKFGE